MLRIGAQPTPDELAPAASGEVVVKKPVDAVGLSEGSSVYNFAFKMMNFALNDWILRLKMMNLGRMRSRTRAVA